MQASGIWWPALLTVQHSDSKDGEGKGGDDTLLRVAGNLASEVVIAHLLGEEDRPVAALRAADQGATWRFLADDLHSSPSHQTPTVPAALQRRYDAAVAALDAAAATAADYGAKNVVASYEGPHGAAEAAVAAGRALGKRKSADESPSASAFVLDAAAAAAASAGIPHPGPAAALCPLNHHHHDAHQRVTKRAAAIPWDDYFMAVAFLSAMRSKDPSTQVRPPPFFPPRSVTRYQLPRPFLASPPTVRLSRRTRLTPFSPWTAPSRRWARASSTRTGASWGSDTTASPAAAATTSCPGRAPRRAN